MRPTDIADAGLVYVTDDEPGYTRIRRGRGFSYRSPNGSTVRSERIRTWIESLAVPPAWTDVWICRDPNGHLLATGRDSKGRKQYIYHPGWTELRDAAKFDRMFDFGRRLRRIRKRTRQHLDLTGLPRERVLALVVRLMDETLIRVGNSRYAARNDSYGLTTLRSDHVDVAGGSVSFAFDAKNSTPVEITVANPKLAKVVAACSELGGEEVFAYCDGDRMVDVDSSDVNDYLQEIASAEVTAKDFRTWGGSSVVFHHLATGGSSNGRLYLDAIDAAAAALHNTPAVCRASYVHPMLEDAHESGAILEAWQRSRSGTWYERAESGLLKALAA